MKSEKSYRMNPVTIVLDTSVTDGKMLHLIPHKKSYKIRVIFLLCHYINLLLTKLEKIVDQSN